MHDTLTSSVPTSLRRALGLGLCAAAAAATAACSAPGDSAGKDSQTVDVVASTPIWADIAKLVGDTAEGGITVDASSVVEGNGVDPHHFEPSAADIAKAHRADLVVAGGGGYDAWLYEPLSDQDSVAHALPLVAHGDLGVDHSHDEPGDITPIDGNEHVWYAADAINKVAEDIADYINSEHPEAHASAQPVLDKTQELEGRITKLGEKRYAQTEPIADYLLDPSPMEDVTPAGFRKATLGHGEPAAADLARFLEAIDNHELDVLIYNPQTETDMTARIRTAAEKANIPIVEIGETPPDGTDFFAYYDSVVHNLEEAAR
ncbi:metal ABC transporter solute-binding protein, Zn/Mn family [Corynebacterium massiliense]|uniref:Periplasmic solute binding protein family protein n=1 Tax=Corynebacterium massiliense DSM 45435 TaxID=1121364 RepID=A0ABY7U9Y2_9CORY|nr:zinc ABC transporter substrate-binding protein [Corynebacterium massiliense]WCZ33176.1 Periplasmic solute binding protein family protein [Corynebacterium massiliense DSM 45435]